MESQTPSGLSALLRSYLRFTLLLLAACAFSRLCLVLWKWDRVMDADGLFQVFLNGVRFDLVVIGMVLMPIVALGTPLMAVPALQRPMDIFRRHYLFFFAALVIFLELATPSFIDEYDTRPNFLFVEYLKYPKEVFSTVWGAYKWPLIGVVLVSIPGLFWLHKQFVRRNLVQQPLGILSSLGVVFLLGPVTFMMVRSTLDHRAVNPSVAAFSSDPLVNALGLPSSYNLGYAIYETLRHEGRSESPYGRVPYEDAIAAQRAFMGLDESAFTSSESPFLHHQEPTHARDKPLNLVILLEESLGAEFIGSLGGLPLSPRIDEWSKKAMSFEHMYATGTRSVRGIEAVITGFPPTPARSIVKLPRSQRGFFTLAELLGRAGYHTSFQYGGEAHFDNMARFFTGNGFQHILDQGDFEDPAFTGSWGASDEDLFDRAHAEFLRLHQAGEPFFSLVFSSSNHSPFEYPEGRIEPYEEPAGTRFNASKYADYALGRFLDQASQSEYWNDTVFLVVADHCSRVFGSSLVPVEHFHIPAFFLGADIEPQKISTLARQLDLLPTALSLIGIAGEHPAAGRDLTRPEEQAKPGGAILQYYDTRAQFFGNDVVILRPKLAPASFRLENETLIPVERNDRLIQQAKTLAAWPAASYQKGDYKLDKP